MPRAEDTGGLFRLAMASQQTNSEPSRSLQGLSNSDQATLVAGGARADRQAIIEKAAAGEMASGARRQPMFTKIIPWRAKQIQTFAWFQIVRLFAPATEAPPGASLTNDRPDVACLSISDMNRWVTLVFNKFASSPFLH